jgi:hypothetical protein
MALGKKQGGGKSRSGSETRKRGPRITFRVTDGEQAQIQANAGRAGLTVGSYARSRTLKQPTTRAVRRPPVETAQLSQLLGLMGAVGGDLRLIANNLNAGGTAENTEVAAALTCFREAAAAIMQLLGKRANDY